MSNLFKCIDDGSRLPIRFNKTKRHLIFDVKFDLSKKPRYIGSGNLTQVSAFMSYSRVVSRESVRIIFLIAALNYLDRNMCDIGNAYVIAETRERLWFTAVPEWGNKK